MKRAPCLIIVLASVVIGPRVCHASFDRELENLNRQQSMRVLDEFREDIDDEIRELNLSSEQIAESISLEESAIDADKKKEILGRPTRPQISREQLRALLGMKIDDGSEDIPLQLRPSISMDTLRESNVFGRRIDALGETTFSYVPGVKARARWHGWDGETNYGMTRLLHRNFTQNDRVHQNISQSLTKSTGKVTWRFVSQYALAGVNSERESEKPSRYAAQTNSAAAAMPITSKLAASLGYSLDSRSFLSDIKDTANSRTQTYRLGLSYAMTAKTRLTGGYVYRTSRPPKGVNSDNIDFQDFSLGVNGRISNKIFYRTLATYKFAKRNIEAVPLGGALSYDASLSYLYSAKTKFSLFTQSSTVPTLNETESDPRNDVFGLSINYQAARNIALSAGESVRLIQAGQDPVTFVDPDYPTSIVNVSGHDVVWSTDAGLTVVMDPSSRVLMRYSRIDYDSTLKLTERTNHIWEVKYDKAF